MSTRVLGIPGPQCMPTSPATLSPRAAAAVHGTGPSAPWDALYLMVTVTSEGRASDWLVTLSNTAAGEGARSRARSRAGRQPRPLQPAVPPLGLCGSPARWRLAGPTQGLRGPGPSEQLVQTQQPHRRGSEGLRSLHFPLVSREATAQGVHRARPQQASLRVL